MNNFIIYGAVILSIAAAILAMVTFITHKILNTLPSNSPEGFTNSEHFGNKDVIVNIGDSITHGVVSANYSKLIKSEVAGKNYYTVNAGINADLAVTVNRRMDKILACKPKIATVLIGTNDVMAANGKKEVNNYRKFGRIQKGDTPSFEFYQENLTKIVSTLKANNIKHIYLLSLPLLGEDLNEAVNQRAKKYSDFVKQLAEQEQVNYIPLNESMRKGLDSIDKPLGFGAASKLINNLLVARHYFFKTNLDKLFAYQNYQYLTEGIHLNSKGARLIADLVLEAIKPKL